MAESKRRMRRSRRRAPQEQEQAAPEPEVQEEEAAAEPDPEPVEEPEEKPKKKEPAKPKAAEKEEPAPEAEVEPEEVKTTTRRRTKAPTPGENSIEPKDDPAPKFTPELTPGDVFLGLWDKLQDGESLILTRTSEDTLTLATRQGTVKNEARQKKGIPPGYYDAALTDDYKEWEAEWGEMSIEDKVAYGHDEGIEWEEHKLPSVNMLRLAPKVREKLGINKYKDEYSTDAARKQLKKDLWLKEAEAEKEAA